MFEETRSRVARYAVAAAANLDILQERHAACEAVEVPVRDVFLVPPQSIDVGNTDLQRVHLAAYGRDLIDALPIEVSSIAFDTQYLERRTSESNKPEQVFFQKHSRHRMIAKTSTIVAMDRERSDVQVAFNKP